MLMQNTTLLLLIGLVGIPSIYIILISLFPRITAGYLHSSLLFISLVSFLLAIGLFLVYDPFQLSFQACFILNNSILSNHNIIVAVDSISVVFILLTTFLFPICILVNYKQLKTNLLEYAIAFLCLEILLILVFCVLDTLGFYILFESVLIPMFLYIGIWGSRERKVYAAYLLFLYTLFGSLLMLIGLLYVYYITGTTDLQMLWLQELSTNMQFFLWIAFFASFSVKIPMFPVHIWLPEAHVEAPTAGSVLLAGILLKLGGYGFLRFTLPMCPNATIYFLPAVYTLCTIGIIYTSLTTLRQTDMKRIIAYSSVAHMNLVVLGLFSQNALAIEGSIYLMLSHGVVSGGLFLCVGQVYATHKTRLIKYYGGLVQLMPIFASCLFIFTMANLSLPLTSSFVGEFIILLGLFYQNAILLLIVGTTVVLGAGYSLWFYNRILFGNLNIRNIYCFSDVTRLDFMLYVPLVIFIIIGGICPSIFFNILHNAIHLLLSNS
jgi:proton-translocating NADH-quinone oxidoreductase chain M